MLGSTISSGYHFQFSSEKQWSQTEESVSSRFQFDLKRMVGILSSAPFTERHENGSHTDNSFQMKNSSIFNDFIHRPISPKLIDQTRLKHHKKLIACYNTKSSPVATQDKSDFAQVCSSSTSTSDAPVDVEKELQNISTLTISTNVRDSEVPNNDCIPPSSSASIPANDHKVKSELDDWLEDILH